MESWTRSETSMLIKLFSQHRCLYDMKDKDANNRTKRFKAYEFLKNEIQKVKPGATVTVIKSKIKTLKRQYREEKRKILQSKKGSTRREDDYMPKLWCYNSLLFLEEPNKKCSSWSNFESSESLDIAIEDKTGIMTAKKRKENLEQVSFDAISVSNSIKENTVQARFCNYICGELYALNDQELTKVMKDIVQLVQDAKAALKQKETKEMSTNVDYHDLGYEKFFIYEPQSTFQQDIKMEYNDLSSPSI